MIDILILITLAFTLAMSGFAVFMITIVERDVNHLIDLIDCMGALDKEQD